MRPLPNLFRAATVLGSALLFMLLLEPDSLWAQAPAAQTPAAQTPAAQAPASKASGALNPAKTGALGPLSDVSVVSGKVVDGVTGEPLPYAALRLEQASRGVLADAQGAFRFARVDTADRLQVAFPGYNNLFRKVQPGDTGLVLRLQPTTQGQQTVEINSTANPAVRLIRQAQQFAPRHQPAQRESYYYETYTKLVLGPTDSAEYSNRLDTLFRDADLFLWEALTGHVKQGKETRERLLSSQISGLSETAFPLRPQDIQGLSVHEPQLTVLGASVPGPLHPRALKLYRYRLDSLELLPPKGEGPPDTLFTLAFYPARPGDDLLSGTLRMHSRGYAILTLEAQLRLSARQERIRYLEIKQYHRPLADSAWFPLQTNTIIELQQGPDKQTRRLRVTADSYLREPQFTNQEKRLADWGKLDYSIAPQAAERDSSYWLDTRPVPLEERGYATYQKIDSFSQENNLEQKLERLLALQDGYFPVGPVELALSNVYSYNPVEGHRLQMGVATSPKRFRYGRLLGYVGYAFGDQRYKAGFIGEYTLPRDRRFRLRLTLRQDVPISGSNQSLSLLPVAYHSRRADLLDISGFFAEIRDYTRLARLTLHTPGWRSSLSFRGSFELAEVTPAYGYRFAGLSQWTRYVSRFSLRWAPGERWVEGPRDLEVDRGSGLVVELNYQLGFVGHQLDYLWHLPSLGVYQPFKLRRLGQLILGAEAGAQFGEAPYPSQYVFPATGAENVWGSAYTFQTQPINGWTATRFAVFYSRLSIQNEQFPAQVFSPEPDLILTTGWGSLQGLNASLHEGFVLRAPNGGLYELGFRVKDLFPVQVYRILPFFRELALGFYYNWGPESPASFRQSYALKLELDNFLPN